MNQSLRKRRRVLAALALLVGVIMMIVVNADNYELRVPAVDTPAMIKDATSAQSVLDTLEVKGRAPTTGYSRAQFGDGWDSTAGCDTRNIILARDLVEEAIGDNCKVQSGILHDPYTGATIQFVRGGTTSDDVQIDHVVALSDAWQKSAQQLSKETRILLANDPLELLAVDGAANQQKSNGDAATWLPSNKPFRCQYVARQIAVKKKYDLWVTLAERDAMARVLTTCPGQLLPSK